MKSSSSTIRLVAAAMIWGAFSIALLHWTGLLIRVIDATQAVARETGGPYPGIVEGLGLNTAAFREGFSKRLPALTDLGFGIRIIGGLRLMMLVLAASGVLYVLKKADLRSQPFLARTLFASLTMLPAVVGLGMAPLIVSASFSALANAGLSNPELVGLGCAEAFWPFYLGCILGIPLLVVFTVLILRQQDH